MYEIDGVPLSDRRGRWRLHRETQRRAPVTMRAVDVTVPGVDGSLPIYGEAVEAAVLGLELNVYGTPAEVEARCAFLRGLLGKTHAPLLVRRRDGAVAEAKPATISDPVMAAHYARISATLTIPAGVWRGPVTGWEADALVGTHNIASLEGGSRPVTDALVLITGPARNLTLTDDATGAVLRFTGDVPAGEQLLVDVGAWRATLGADVTWDSPGHDATALVDGTGPRSSTHLWTLTPCATPAGTTWTSVTVSATNTTAASGLRLRTRTAHL